MNVHNWLRAECKEIKEHNVNMDTLRITKGVSEWFQPACRFCNYVVNRHIETVSAIEIVKVEEEQGISGQTTGRIRLVFNDPILYN